MSIQLLQDIPVKELRTGQALRISSDTYRAIRLKAAAFSPGIAKPQSTLIDRSQLEPGIYLDTDLDLQRAGSWEEAFAAVGREILDSQEVVIIIRYLTEEYRSQRPKTDRETAKSRILRLFCIRS